MTFHTHFEHRGACHRFPTISGDDRLAMDHTELVVYLNRRQHYTALKRSYHGGQIVISRTLNVAGAHALIRNASAAGHVVTTWGIPR